MLVNKKRDMTPYDMKRKPCKQNPLLMPLVWGGSYIMTRQFKLKIDKVNMKNIKPPFLVIGTHQGFTDYYLGPLAMFPHRAMYVSDMEGFAAFGNSLYRGLGCIGKRRYVSDISVVRNMKYALSKGQSVFVYPESRHSNVGTTSYIPRNMGRLAKLMDVPLVILSAQGCYLANPFWDEEHTRKVPVKAKLECIYTKDKLRAATEEDVQKRIEESLLYDEYRYQQENKIKIAGSNRADGLHKALYQCKACCEKYKMISAGDSIKCNCCGASFKLSEDGWMIPETDSDVKLHIPDWYEWERECAIKDVSDRSFEVRVEALPNEKGFVNMGDGKLELNAKEFVLSFADQELHFPHRVRESVQTEYNYRKRGMCIVLSTADCCYYVYSNQEDFNPTELQFVGEYLYTCENKL